MKILLFLVLATANAQFPRLNRTTALKAPKAQLAANSVEANTAPFDLPPGYTHSKITDRNEWNKTSPGLFRSDWGFMRHNSYAIPENNAAAGVYPNADKFIFIPLISTNEKGALLRYNVVDRSFIVLAQSTTRYYNQDISKFNVTNDSFWLAVSACFTPFNTLLWGEQHHGKCVLFGLRTNLERYKGSFHC